MTNLELFALAKAVSESKIKKFKNSLPEGEHEIDLIVHILGNIEITHGEKDSTVSIPWLKAMAIALHKSGIQKDNILNTIKYAVEVSMALGQDEIAEMIGLEFGDLETLVKKFKDEVVKKLPKTPTVYTKCKLVTDKLDLEDVDLSTIKHSA